MNKKPNKPVIPEYLALMDAQREQTFLVLKDIRFDQLWQRPAPQEWSIGEILNHNVLLYQSVFSLVRFSWRYCRWMAKLMSWHDYAVDIDDPYRKKWFPHWTGFIWKPKVNPENPVSLDVLKAEMHDMHQKVRDFYQDKDEQKLGRVFLFDPLFGFINLIVTLRIGIYHDQLHFEDVLEIWGDISGVE